MTTTSPSPPGFDRFSEQTQGLVTPAPYGPMYRFNARWRIARSYRGLLLEGYRDERTVQGYESLLRLWLAYSTVDQLDSVIGRKWLTTLPDADLASKLRTLRIDSLVTNEKVSGMRKQGALDAIHTTDDLLVFAAALRHAVVHGSGTSAGLGLSKPQARKAVDELSERLLLAAEEAYERWIDEMLPGWLAEGTPADEAVH